MKITIVNGINDKDYPKEIESLNKSLSQLKTENDINQFDIHNMNINNCIGCWNCWMDDPGQCVLDDDMIEIHKSTVVSDMIIFVSSIKAGFLQKEIKRSIERMFALLMPHIKIVKDECHHVLRYDNKPKLGLVVVGADQTCTEQKEILEEYMYRLSLNFNHGTGHFVHYYNNEKELVNEINNI